MKRIKLLLMTVLLVASYATTQAQFGDRLGKAIKKSAEDATVRKSEQKTDQGVSKTIDKVTDPNTYKDKDKDKDKSKNQKTDEAGNSNSNNQSASDDTKSQSADNADSSGDNSAVMPAKSLEMAYAKSDFVPGDKIIFDDDVTREKAGEFPSQWDLKEGNAEIASINGVKVINIHKNSNITPLMSNMKEYLPEVYTLEFDFFYFGKKRDVYFDRYLIEFKDKDGHFAYDFDIEARHDDALTIHWKWKNPSDGEHRTGSQKITGLTVGEFHHFAVSFNKRALKLYVNGERTANIPNATKASRFDVMGTGGSEIAYFIKSIRMSEGAVPLYDRMMSDGKFITYGITFDVGKSTIKPESMGEMNRILQLLTENPTLKFSVEGHTDNTGTAATNQTLSEARSKAVVDKLVSMGVATDRLKSAGKGQSNPIADNGTDEGKAKNRRVEFIKL